MKARPAYTIKVYEDGSIFVTQELLKSVANAAGFTPVAATIKLQSTNPGGALSVEKKLGEPATMKVTPFHYKPDSSAQFKKVATAGKTLLSDETLKDKAKTDKPLAALMRNTNALLARAKAMEEAETKKKADEPQAPAAGQAPNPGHPGPEAGSTAGPASATAPNTTTGADATLSNRQ